jgi:hypothetical protein
MRRSFACHVEREGESVAGRLRGGVRLMANGSCHSNSLGPALDAVGIYVGMARSDLKMQVLDQLVVTVLLEIGLIEEDERMPDPAPQRHRPCWTAK